MNEFVAKKLGEVLAFSRVGTETFEKGKDALRQGLGDETVIAAMQVFEDLAAALEAAAQASDQAETTLKKATATGDKLKTMRDMYVGDEWDNPAELLEWLGFFQGAAVVHWCLVVGAAQSLADAELESLAHRGVEENNNLLNKVREAITQVGKTRATE